MSSKIYNIGDTVYHIADSMQTKMLITGIVERPHNVVTYLASSSEAEREYFSLELTDEKAIF